MLPTCACPLAEDASPAAPRRFTVFEPRLDYLRRPADRDWTLIDYISAALRHRRTQVASIFVITQPMPEFPTPQLVVTPNNHGLEGRAIPVCLARVGGETHTVVLRPPCTHASVYQQLHEKGVDPAHHWERAHAAGRLTFRDQTGTVLETWTDSEQLEWAELSADDDSWAGAEVDYAGGDAIVWRLAAPESTTSTTTGSCTECADAAPNDPPSLPESDPPALLLRAPEARQGKAMPAMLEAGEPYVLRISRCHAL